MRPLLALGILALSFLPLSSHASWGIWQSYVIIDSGSGDQYLAGGLNADGASAFAGTDLGDFTAADALTLNGGELKTYKNGSSNVCGGTLNYRVYASGNTPGAFTALALPFSANLSGSDQKWAATGQAIDLLDALTPGDYVLELYWEADGNDSNPSGCGESKYDSDSGNNFTATFSVLSTGACGTSVNFDGYDYETVQIGDQCWFAENLRTTVYADGTAIPEVTDQPTWNWLSSGARCDYNHNASNAAFYGRLYNWYAADDPRGLCPSGWHVPSDEEWTTLENYITSQNFNGTEGTALKATSGWIAGGNGTDDFGFSALPGGRRWTGLGFIDAGEAGNWWSSTISGVPPTMPDTYLIKMRALNTSSILYEADLVARIGMSVRCLGDADQTEPQGCTDPGYIEYDASATTDDGSCATLVVEGCTDSGYTEYDPSANVDDGSCATQIVFGCTDDTACNYSAGATENDGSCTYPDAGYDCAGNCINDTDADGTCDEFEVNGCTDDAACNYSDTATENDGSCTYPAAGYDCAGNCINDTDADGTCDEFEVNGCTDDAACNYSDTATENDGSCTYPDAGYDCAGNCINDTDADGTCDEFEVNGCTDDAACNYSAGATDDDGSCTYPAAGYDCAGNCINDADADGTCDEFEVNGCTDAAACNYSAGATDDDGSCESLSCAGCTNAAYTEYDASATIDDGSCQTLADACEGALVLNSIQVDLSTTTLTSEDGSATLTVTTGTPTSLTLNNTKGAPDYSFDQPGSIDGIASGVYNVTATDDSGCESNALTLVMTYALCCDCGVSDIDTDGICDDEDNCTDRTAPNYDDPNNTDCILGDD